MIAKFLYAHNKKKIENVVNFIDGHKTVLDVGCGNCVISSILSEKGYKVTPIDVIDISKSEIRPTIYDGKKIPFDDNSFDVSLLIYVLHHEINQLNLLKEVIRVTKKRIIIFEDTPQNKIEQIFNSFFDTFWNSLQHVKSPLCFNNSSRWEKLFKDHGLNILYRDQSRPLYGLWTYRQTSYVLDKK